MNQPHAVYLALLILASLTSTTGCDETEAVGQVALAPTAEAIGIAECAACGMVVREQSAPRGQVLHRDGTRRILLALGDLVQYMQAPSPHGSTQATFVEALEQGFDPSVTDTKARPWIAAKAASYVVGVERERVMGPPVLSFTTLEHAQAAATKHGGSVTNWSDLKSFVIKKE